MIDEARAVLARHGYATAGLRLLGEGGQSWCYGTDAIAVLLCRRDVSAHSDDLTGHSHGASAGGNPYALPRWMADRAADAGMRTPRILAIGDAPRPYAVVEPARGVVASRHPAVASRTVEWHFLLGQEVRKANSVETSGFGTFVPDGAGFRGPFATWSEFLESWLERYLDDVTATRFLAQNVLGETDLARVRDRVRSAQSWPVRSVLTHYDNRLDNVVVEGDSITVLDWVLAFSGIGIAHELIKIFETAPTSAKDLRVAAYLRGYGLTDAEAAAAVEDGKLMLALDGLAMSAGWLDRPDRQDGVRAWLRTVRRLTREW